MLTAIVALTIAFSATASHSHTAACAKACITTNTSLLSVPDASSRKIAVLKDQQEEVISKLHYEQSMTRTLNQLKEQKLGQQLENLQAEKSYNRLMYNLFSKISNEKATSEIEELEAAIRFEKLMNSTLSL